MAKKFLGQNFLYNHSILERIVQAAQLEPQDLVVEIGPGPGILTRMLASRVEKVLAIELDRDLFEKSKNEVAGYSNVEFIHGDALEYPYQGLPEFKVVANIPYYITTPIIFKLLDAGENMISMTLTIQKEVAERIAAKPGGKDYGVLSIMVQYLGAFFVETKVGFYFVGLLAGVSIGSCQSASRSLMARLTPPKHEAEFFGFYDGICGNASAIMGPSVFGLISALTGSQRTAVLSIGAFFLAGLIVLQRVKEQPEPTLITQSTT
jgi:SAM-dependent methyltransferase